MSRNSITTMSTFVMAGTLAKSALTTTFSSGFLDTILRGHSARSALRALRLLRLATAPSPPKTTSMARSATLATTTMKSSRFHQFKIYGLMPGRPLWKKPSASILKMASKLNSTVNRMSTQNRVIENHELGLLSGVSTHKVIELRMIRVRIIDSKIFDLRR